MTPPGFIGRRSAKNLHRGLREKSDKMILYLCYHVFQKTIWSKGGTFSELNLRWDAPRQFLTAMAKPTRESRQWRKYMSSFPQVCATIFAVLGMCAFFFNYLPSPQSTPGQTISFARGLAILGYFFAFGIAGLFVGLGLEALFRNLIKKQSNGDDLPPKS
jgi:hypothetical protein